MRVPVDARYFPRGGVCDAELEAMEVFDYDGFFFWADKIRCLTTP